MVSSFQILTSLVSCIFCLTLLPRSFASCNVESPGLTQVDLDEVVFTASSPLEVIFPSAVLSDPSLLRIVEIDQSGNGDTASSSWFNKAQRVSDGFICEFSFQISNGTSEGLAFVLQHERIEDIHGGVGDNFGFKNTLTNYFALTFDFCPNRDEINSISTPCAGNTLSLLAKKSNNILSFDNTAITFNLNSPNTVKITYLADVTRSTVILNNNIVLEADFSLLELFSSRFAFVGFSASNSGASPANIDILDFKLQTLLSDSKVVESFPKQSPQDKRVSFNVTIRDTCDKIISYPQLVNKNITLESFSGNLTFENQEENTESRTAVQIADVIDNKDGSFLVIFQMPENLLGSWKLDIYVNDVQSQNMPISNSLETFENSPSFLQPQTIGILVGVLLFILLLMLLAIQNLDYYRRKLKKHKNDILAGHEVVQIENLEKDMNFQTNKLIKNSVGDIEKAIADNIIELQRLKMRHRDQIDTKNLIYNLEKENLDLRQKLKDLKLKEERNKVFSEKNNKMNFVNKSVYGENEDTRKEFAPTTFDLNEDEENVQKYFDEVQ